MRSTKFAHRSLRDYNNKCLTLLIIFLPIIQPSIKLDNQQDNTTWLANKEWDGDVADNDGDNDEDIQ